jgi:hypothetical protein
MMEKKYHCQICGREIKGKKGLIAHHGYKRMGGWQTSSCIGARELPYEKSRDVIPKAIKMIENYVSNQESLKANTLKDNLPVPSLFRNELLTIDSPFYKIRQDEFIRHIESDIKFANRDKERLQKRYDDWVLQDD